MQIDEGKLKDVNMQGCGFRSHKQIGPSKHCQSIDISRVMFPVPLLRSKYV